MEGEEIIGSCKKKKKLAPKSKFDIMNGIVRQIILPLHDVGDNISSTSLFIGTNLSPSNRLQRKIDCHLFKTNLASLRDLISYCVRLVST
jgi:hypothetical protein